MTFNPVRPNFLSLNLSMPTFRNDDRKRTPVVWRTGNGNLPVVGPGNSPGKTEPQPGAGLRPAGVAAIKAFKNLGKILF
jgi:hypothetical protein